MNAPLKIFVIYAREDLVFKNNLLNAFIPLERTGRVKVFHDALIKPGERWEDIILDNLRTAHIIVPLVSPDFFASDFIRDVEFQKAKERYEKGEITIMPIILKHCGWKYDPDISTLQVLPRDGKPVVTWTYHEEAWEQVLDAVHEITEREKAAARRKQEEAEAKKRRAAAEPFFNFGRDATDPIDQIVHYSKAIEIDPDYSSAYNNRGIAKINLKQYDKAIKGLDKAILLDPNFPFAYNNRGVAKGNLNQLEEAKKDYQKALSLDPNFETAKNNLKVLEERMALAN